MDLKLALVGHYFLQKTLLGVVLWLLRFLKFDRHVFV